MARILVVILGLGAVSAAMYIYLNQNVSSSTQLRPSAHQTLQNVRGRAKDIENDAQKRVDDVSKTTDSIGN